MSVTKELERRLLNAGLPASDVDVDMPKIKRRVSQRVERSKFIFLCGTVCIFFASITFLIFLEVKKKPLKSESISVGSLPVSELETFSVNTPEEMRQAEIGKASTSDLSGGRLFMFEGQLIHKNSSGSYAKIFPDSTEDTWTYTVTDLVQMGGIPYLLVDRFDSQSGYTDVVEVSIVAVDLQSDTKHVVEDRRIENADPQDWIYNDHITSDGSNILVARSLWQGACYYTETLTVDGKKLRTNELYPKPSWMFSDSDVLETYKDDLSLIDPETCVTSEEWEQLGGGSAVLGQNVDVSVLN